MAVLRRVACWLLSSSARESFNVAHVAAAA